MWHTDNRWNLLQLDDWLTTSDDIWRVTMGMCWAVAKEFLAESLLSWWWGRNYLDAGTLTSGGIGTMSRTSIWPKLTASRTKNNFYSIRQKDNVVFLKYRVTLRPESTEPETPSSAQFIFYPCVCLSSVRVEKEVKNGSQMPLHLRLWDQKISSARLKQMFLRTAGVWFHLSRKPWQ